MEIRDLLNKMTLEQKLAQLTQVCANCLHIGENGDITGPATLLNLSSENISAVGSTLNFGIYSVKNIQEEHIKNDINKIPLLFMLDVVHGLKTIYPIPLALGASFDTEIAKKCCQMASKESSLIGVNVTFSPMVDLVRDARWGRCMESTGEDAYLNSVMGRAMVEGYQGDLSQKENIIACVKHFAGYGQAEAGRDYNTTDISERSLRDYYLPAYKECVDAGVKMVMTSFNSLNGVPSSGNKWLVNDILRKEWNFKGVVISDYAAFDEMIVHGYVENKNESAKRAIEATSDIEMMSNCYLKELPSLIENGSVTMEQIDNAVMRILELKQEMDLLNKPFCNIDLEEFNKVALSKEHREIARIAEEKSAVLLKNENILPFDKNKVKKVGVIGPFSDVGMIGSWACYGAESDAITVYQGVKNLLNNAEVLCENACNGDLIEDTNENLEKAINLAKQCDSVILCIGEQCQMSGESRSRATLRLSNAQKDLIKEIHKVNKNVVGVIFCGRPLVLSDVIDYLPSVVIAWQPGTEGGNAIANLLFGEVNFSAKLPMTFPRTEGQIPIYYNSLRTGRPKLNDNTFGGLSVYSSNYMDTFNSPLYPFGYGLSYTNFEIASPVLSKNIKNIGENISICVKIKNVGNYVGEEVLQLYICDEVASFIRPIKELKSFKKISLKPNEEKEITFTITDKMLEFWTENKIFEVEKGWFTVWISNRSDILNNPVRFKVI